MRNRWVSDLRKKAAGIVHVPKWGGGNTGQEVERKKKGVERGMSGPNWRGFVANAIYGYMNSTEK